MGLRSQKFGLIISALASLSFGFTPNVGQVEKETTETIPVNVTIVNEGLIGFNNLKIEEVAKIPPRNEVYDGMTMEELSDKLNRSLNSTLAGRGSDFAKYSIEYGVDPYLALAIVLHETGCKWNCSNLVKSCNNIGGQKGSPGCGGGSYKSFPTLDEGIKGFFANLYKNYYSYGLTTPEAIGPKYAASTTWSTKINNYIREIKNK